MLFLFVFQFLNTYIFIVLILLAAFFDLLIHFMWNKKYSIKSAFAELVFYNIIHVISAFILLRIADLVIFNFFLIS
jgi:hypothetical protein